MDLAEGHVCAIKKIQTSEPDLNTYSVYNLGSGQGCSVLDMIEGMKKASGRDVPYEYAPRRAGDIAVSYADAKKAFDELGWATKRSLEEMCRGKIEMLWVLLLFLYGFKGFIEISSCWNGFYCCL